MSRLSEDVLESVSQALTTVRRIIDAFADSIYPPSDETINIGGNELSLSANKHQNRINALCIKKQIVNLGNKNPSKLSKSL